MVLHIPLKDQINVVVQIDVVVQIYVVAQIVCGGSDRFGIAECCGDSYSVVMQIV